MDNNEGILIEVERGRVARVMTNGAPLPAGAAVTYDAASTRLLPVDEPTSEEQIERISAALREGRMNTQRYGIRVACQAASKHYQAIAQATGALASLLADMTRTKDGEPAVLLTRIQEAVNRIDNDVLGEVRQQLFVTCAQAMELRVGAVEEDERPLVQPVQPAQPATAANGVRQAEAAHCEPRELPPEPPRVAYPR